MSIGNSPIRIVVADDHAMLRAGMAAIINAQADGSILVEVGVHENGQGSESAMLLLVAEELGP